MAKDYTISIYLDNRRAKSNGRFPVKLRVYSSTPQKRKYYGTKFEFTADEFNKIWLSKKPRKEYKDTRRELSALEKKADDVAKNLNPFTFEQFEKKLYRKHGDGIRLKYNYEQTINSLLANKQIGTANTYQTAEKSFIKFINSGGRQNYNSITFFDIDQKWLERYEYFMVEVNGKSYTTVSMYLRTLRALFNSAIESKEIEKEFYPFGKKKYQIPNSNNVKKALNKIQLKTLFNSIPQTADQQKAKDFWFFSYSCNGINTKDIALLRYKDIVNDKITFYRAKTRLTSKGNLKQIQIYLTNYSKNIILKYGSKNQEPNQLIFDIIQDHFTAAQKQKAVKNFTRFINQHLQILCKANDLPANTSTMFARHSFASNFVLTGATVVDAMESLGHSNIQTTQNYLRSFDDDTKKEFAKSLMNFD